MRCSPVRPCGWRHTIATAAWVVWGAVATAQPLDTSSWAGQDGQVATAALTGLAQLTVSGGAGGGGVLRADPAAPAGAYIDGGPGAALSFRVYPPSATPGDQARVWFALRAVRTPGSTFAGNPFFRIHQVAGGTLRTTVYLRDDEPSGTPNGAFAKARGLSLHSQSNLPGGVDVGLTGTQWNVGAPVMSFDRWTDLEFEVVRSAADAGGRSVALVNGVPVGGLVNINTTSLSPAQLDASLTISLPAIAGLSWQLSGPIGTASTARTYARSGAAFAAPASVARLLSIPATLDVPWSPLTAEVTGPATLLTDTFVSGGLSVDRRRLIVSGSTGASVVLASAPLGEGTGPDGWTTLVVRELLVEPGVRAQVAVAHGPAPGAAQTRLWIAEGGVRLSPDGESVLSWTHAHRAALLVHLHPASGERALTLINLSADGLGSTLLTSAALPSAAPFDGGLGPVEISAGVDVGPARLELGGVALCRRADIMMVDSYVSAFTTMPPPRLVTLSRLGRVFFSGVDADLVPGRPSFADQHPDAPMPLLALGRSGGRLSAFLAANAQGGGGVRGSRMILCAGFVNELSNQATDPYWVDTFARAAQKANEVAQPLLGFVQSLVGMEGPPATARGNSVVLVTPVAVPLYSANPAKSSAFTLYNQRLREMAAALGGDVRLADVEGRLSPAEHAALFTPDQIHMSAAGDIAVAQIIADALRGPATGPVTLAWSFVGGGVESASDGTLTLDGTVGQFAAAEPLVASTPLGPLELVGGYWVDAAPAPCLAAALISADVVTACPGAVFTAEVYAAGGGGSPLAYTWMRNGEPIDASVVPSAASPVLTVAVVIGEGAGGAGVYTCRVSAPCGSVTSAGVELIVDGADLGVQGGQPGRDGAHDNNDFVVFVDAFFRQESGADLGRQGGLPGRDGLYDNNDFVVFVDLFFLPCP